MEIDFLRRARIAGHAFSDIANWREVLPRAAAGKSVTEIRLRNGLTITAPPENALWPHFSDIWYHLSYTKHCAILPNSLVVDLSHTQNIVPSTWPVQEGMVALFGFER
jgi:hypothetical protein